MVWSNNGFLHCFFSTTHWGLNNFTKTDMQWLIFPITIYIKSSETCSGLPPDISHLKTDMSFPVSYNTRVSVSCLEDRELRGDEVITCNQDTDFKFQSKPKCNDVGMCNYVFIVLMNRWYLRHRSFDLIAAWKIMIMNHSYSEILQGLVWSYQ